MVCGVIWNILRCFETDVCIIKWNSTEIVDLKNKTKQKNNSNNNKKSLISLQWEWDTIEIQKGVPR